ncbi:glycine cleavage T C-terminal barrel domain-containing protein [Hoeflea sp. TYP-13]|uniref:glycine cleavage T C-terminal barrel domain-containing protein n=1 Tax=Hoeflea sp. TYP-13 TaxID=3230023 RepID=UPI0034C66C37
MYSIMPSARLRPSPFFNATVAEGVTSFTTYNNMLMPTGYGRPQEEYWRIINGVSMWDVAVERQIQLQGRDAGRLAQILAPRDLSKCVEGQGKYVALCNHAGTIINDPILLKLADDRYWLSIADSNILFWARAIAAERGLDVAVTEADVSPLAVQGPKAEDVVASMFGDWIRDLKYFWFRETAIDGIPVAVARSGWSKQGGFELYLMDGSKGTALWNLVKEAGQPFNIGPGNPNACERIESGLLSWGGDTDDQTNPFEVRMGAYVDLDVADDVIGIKALRRIKEEGPMRHLIGAVLEGDEPTQIGFSWYDIVKDGVKIGDLTNHVWSYRMEKNIGFALVSADVPPGTDVVVDKDGEAVPASLRDLPFL